MNLKYLEAFLALAKYKNYSEAAEELYISQSSLSKYIQKLEDSLDVKLFSRDSTGTTLTKYGKIYLTYAQKIESLQKRCLREINDAYAQQQALKIGAIPSASEYGIIDLVIQFMKQSKIKCQVTNDTSSDLENKLKDGKIDIAFIKNPIQSDFCTVPYEHDHLVVVLPKSHPLSKNEVINISELKNEDFIFEPVNSRPYRLCMNLCKNAGFTPNVIYADHQISNILDFVQKGIGVSLLMSKLVSKLIKHSGYANLTVLPIDPPVAATIDMCYLDNDTNKAYKQKFIEFAVQESQTLQVNNL